jgi:mannose-6-phosphate isomerase-like protein (cupin superfamily)
MFQRHSERTPGQHIHQEVPCLPFVKAAALAVVLAATSVSCASRARTTATSAGTMPTAAPVEEMGQMEMNASAGMQWSPFNMPGVAPGLQLAVIHGNPSGGGDYTIRLRFPDGYEFPPHWHPKSEHVTVLQGSLAAGMGERFDRGMMREFGPGDFLYIPPRAPHYVRVRGETVIQLHGQGPFEIRLVRSTQ